jgi:hypothetical protein
VTLPPLVALAGQATLPTGAALLLSLVCQCISRI